MNEAARQGELLRDEGMQRAVDHADRETAQWSNRALAAVRVIAILNETFTTEAVVQYATEKGVPLAPDPRAWGAVVRTAVKRGYMRPGHYEKSLNPRAHRRPVQVWLSNLFQIRSR